MVNTLNVSAYKAQPPGEFKGEDRHYISGGPIYPLEDLKAILNSGEQSLNLWTKKCIKDVQTLFDGDLSNICELLNVIVQNKAKYLKSEWCVGTSPKTWAACDSYSIRRMEWNDDARKEMDVEYYVKFAISKTGKLLLIVSCHLSS